MGIIGFGTMMPIRYYLQEQERKEREQMMYELSRASSKWMQATGDSMMQDINRQQMESLTASMKSLDEIGRSLDSLGSSIALLDTTSLLAERSETTQVRGLLPTSMISWGSKKFVPESPSTRPRRFTWMRASNKR
jgi:hypothetical protein